MITLFKNIKLFNKIKVTAIAITLCLSIAYAIFALYNFVYQSEFSRTLKLDSIRIDTSKTYLFSTKFRISNSTDTIIIPIENKSFPDSLCTLYFENEWKLKLTNQLRNNNRETVNNVLFPWCCTQQGKLTFFKQSHIINQDTLSKIGVKFNYYSGAGTDRLTLKIGIKENIYLLFSNLSFLNAVVPISKKKDNIIEVNFCNNGDTTKNKYVISLPFLSKNNTPERKYIKINNDKIVIGDSVAKYTSQTDEFDVNNGHFTLRENHDKVNKYILLTILGVLSFISLYSLTRLFYLVNKHRQHNILVIEQQNILQLRILFNCVIFLSFPIIILLIKENPERLKESHFFVPYLLSVMYLLFNINWVWLVRRLKLNESIFKTASNIKSRVPLIILNRLLLIVFLGLLLLLMIKHDQEKFFGVLPVLHFTKVLYVLLAFLTTKEYFIRVRNNHVISKIGIPFEYILFVILSVIIVIFTSDFATPLFTVIAMFLITFIQKGSAEFLWNLIRRFRVHILLFFLLVGSTLYFNISSFYSIQHSKPYRFFSTSMLPNNSVFSQVDEQSKQTVANHIYLVKSTINESRISPNYSSTIIPSWKSTFFSDYSVLWSFKIGRFSFLVVYALILLLISYSILSLLIILNRSIPLQNGQKVYYDKKMVLIFNILLSLLLVQYIYTFLSNLWLLPVTGQSPGLLCPSYFELFFHLLLINSLYYFIDKKVIDNMPDVEVITQIPYTRIKRISLKYIGLIFIFSILLLGAQLYRVSALGSRMAWGNEGKELTSDYSLDSLSILALNAYQANDRIKFNFLHGKYFRANDFEKTEFKVSAASILFNSNIDSLTFLNTKRVLTSYDTLYELNKSLNNKDVKFINNPFYSGCPINSTTINFDLQKYINRQLTLWANRVNRDSSRGHIMLGGSVLIASNDSGNIVSSASYPFLYNENIYHLKYIENEINKVVGFKLKYNNIGNYVNFSEFNTIPGSIVKPLLAYCGFELLPSNEPILRPNNLGNFLGNSLDVPAKVLFEKMANSNLNALKEIYRTDFGFFQFKGLTQDFVSNLDSKTFNSFAIGQQEPLVFKEVVQAYTRIKTGRKIVLRYYTKDTTHNEPLSIKRNRLTVLQTAMKKCLTIGTAGANCRGAGNVGKAFRDNGVKNYNQFLSKTGTAEIMGQTDNRTSSIIIVTDRFTIGVQLFGDLPSRSAGLDARSFLIQIIPELKRLKML